MNKDFVERLFEEADQLKYKHGKLFDFITSPEFFTLEEEDRELLLLQFDIMKKYIEVLRKRIGRRLGGL